MGSTHGCDAEESDDDEDYWFENAAPRRPQIQQPPPGAGRSANNRIFNKFEPQEPPRIAGIAPPSRKNSASSVGGSGGKQLSPSSQDTSPGARLPRKMILPPQERLNLDDDDDDLVMASPRHHEEDGHDSSSNDDESGPVASPTSPADKPAVAAALEDMSGMLLNITADSTKQQSAAEKQQQQQQQQIPLQQRSRSPSPGRGTAAASPKLNTRSVQSTPDAEDVDAQGSREADNTKVVVTGGHLGGMANAGFEGESEEEDDRFQQGTPSSSSASSSGRDEPDEGSSTHNADAAYARDERDLEAVVEAVLKEQQREEEEQFSDPLRSQPAILPVSAESELDSYEQQPQPQPHLPQRPALFLIHGVGGSAATWNSQMAYFSNLGYEIVAPDLLGHGFSSVPDNPKCYTFNKLFRDVLSVFDHYIPEGRKCVVVAHSYGCSFAAALARTRPSSVCQLLLLASGGPTPLAPPRAMKAMPTALVKCLKPFLRCGLFVRQQQQLQLQRHPRGRQLKFQEAFDVPAYVFRHIMNGQFWPEGDAAFHRRIGVPTLLVYGLKDPFVSLVEMCEMERTLPKAYLELVPLAGHMIMLDQPKELNAMMKRFIEKYTSATNNNGR